MSESVDGRPVAQRERTLADMLRAADVLDRSSCSVDFKIREALEIAVRRAAEVARTFHPGEVRSAESIYASIAQAILADAGLMDV